LAKILGKHSCGCAAAALALKSTIPARAGRTNRVGYDPQMGVSGNLAHESCVLIKLLLRLVRRRKKPGRTLMAFGMSRQKLIWFVKTPGHQEK
jgi:hypothetical protein